MLRGGLAVTIPPPAPLLFDPAERRGCMVCPVLAATDTTVPPIELPPRRLRRRFTLRAPILAPAAAPGAPPDPTDCTCDPARWQGIGAGRIRHEPTCPRRAGI